MIEIAISLAVIGFAVVAIIGVLPYGLEVQGKNREETLINQDGPYLLEAIRNGAGGLDNLTNFVDSITISNRFGRTIYTNSPGLSAPPFDGNMVNGAWIVGLLTTPKYLDISATDRVTNTITAHVRSLSGALVEQTGAAKDLAFGYLLTVEVAPMSSSPVIPQDPDLTNYLAYPDVQTSPGKEERATRKQRWIEVSNMQKSSHDVRLKFNWPLLPNEAITPGRQKVYRALVSSALTNYYTVNTNSVVWTTNYSFLYYFSPQTYVQAQPQQ